MRILLNKLVRLGKGEDGAALILTLALFMFMYVSCAGIFAIGQTAKNRIHLQNACDAAAYSAAVVQADTLSRIATINRAMAWTYVSMTRRQMDVVTYRWLKEVCEHWEDDRNEAKDWASKSTAICSDEKHHGHDHSFDIEGMPLITLYGATKTNLNLKTESEIIRVNNEFNDSYIGSDDSFYTASASLKTGIFLMVDQIKDDRSNIKAMGEAIADLKENYKERAETVVRKVLEANLYPMMKGSISEGVFFFHSINRMDEYVDVMPNNQEEHFLSYIDETLASAFGESGKVWFKLLDASAAKTGFLRGYKWSKGRESDDRLRGQWSWYSNQWHCKKGPYGEDEHIGPFPCPTCKHDKHDAKHCSCEGFPLHFAKVYGDNSRSINDNAEYDVYYEEIYETPREYAAKPNWMINDYFGKKGTITVGLACYNENPWYRIFRKSAGVGNGILNGIFAAFNPYKHVEWSWAFSSAKAGYKFKGDSLDTRDYMVDWNGNQLWNLCQSDWDAVFVPVRRAVSMAKDGKWDGGISPLHDWIMGDGWEPLGSLSVPYRVSSMPDLPGMHVGGGSSGGIQWNKVADMLYH